MSEAYLYVIISVQDVQLVTLHQNLVKNHEARMAQGIAEVDLTQTFMIKMTNWSKKNTGTKKNQCSSLFESTRIMGRSTTRNPIEETHSILRQPERYTDLQGFRIEETHP